MKKAISFIFVLTLVALFTTHSMYVEWAEIFIIIGSLSAISITYNLFSKDKGKFVHILGSSTFIGFFISWVFSLIDILADYYLGVKGIQDGRALTLSEIIMEFLDDLLIISFITMCPVILITLVFTVLYSKFYKKSA